MMFIHTALFKDLLQLGVVDRQFDTQFVETLRISGACILCDDVFTQE
jgi:hypothetical protein